MTIAFSLKDQMAPEDHKSSQFWVAEILCMESLKLGVFILIYGLNIRQLQQMY